MKKFRQCRSLFVGSRDSFVGSDILNFIGIFHRNAEKKENKNGRLCENNRFHYSFDSFLDTVPECMDISGSDNSGGYGINRADKSKKQRIKYLRTQIRNVRQKKIFIMFLIRDCSIYRKRVVEKAPDVIFRSFFVGISVVTKKVTKNLM